MTLICFEVYRNDTRICLAGLGDDAGLHVILDMLNRPGTDGETERDLRLSVSGLHSPEPDIHDFVDWVKLRDLGVGDEIRIRIVEAETPDPPVRVRRETDELIRAAERRYYERVKAKFEGG